MQVTDIVQNVRDSRIAAMEFSNGGKIYKIFANGKVEIEGNFPIRGAIVINRIPMLTNEAA